MADVSFGWRVTMAGENMAVLGSAVNKKQRGVEQTYIATVLSKRFDTSITYQLVSSAVPFIYNSPHAFNTSLSLMWLFMW